VVVVETGGGSEAAAKGGEGRGDGEGKRRAGTRRSASFMRDSCCREREEGYKSITERMYPRGLNA
jgi:hypothetical protein